MSDPRFARLRTDPRFRKPKKHQSKVVVDERFKAIFDDGGLGATQKSQGGRVDKYGRKVKDKQRKDNLRKLYRLEDDEGAADAPTKGPDLARGEVLLESSSEDDDAKSDEEEKSDEDSGEVVLGRHAAKPILVSAEDEQFEVDLNEDDGNAYADLDAQAAAYAHEYAQEEESEPVEGTKTSRLAVVNLDWDHVHATHLYKIFSSLVAPTAPAFAPSRPRALNGDDGGAGFSKSKGNVVRGKVLSVRVYPSEFGKARMKREEVEGPPKEIFKQSRRDDDNFQGELIQEDEGDEYDEDALRKYQLERLRYYYAIVTCDTVRAASHIHSELDGAELERSANVFDLSFVPEGMDFDDEFRDEATPATEAAGISYKGLDFTTDALRHSKVKLKWDEDDPERNKVTRRALTKKEIEEGDYRAYIASSGSDSSDGEGQEVPTREPKGKADRDKLRNLLLGAGDDDLPEGWGGDAFGAEKNVDGEMEITFMPGLSEANAGKDGEDETTLEKYKRKQKEKRLKRKAEKMEQPGTAKEKGKQSVVAKDAFFGQDSDSDEEQGESSTHHEDAAPDGDEPTSRSERPISTEAELALIVAPDDPSAQPKHFDMKAIIKSEKMKGKKGKKGKKKGYANPEDEMQEDFKVDVKDDRFSALYEDHSFAIDPSNPHFKKTKGMAALLEERTKRRSGNREVVERTHERKSESRGDRSLQSLVESVKRKSTTGDAKRLGKRQKTL